MSKAQWMKENLKPGELYSGILLDVDGGQDHHIILLPGDVKKPSWDASVEWAVSIGGELPTRREQSLLFANLKENFQGCWYWSSEQHSGDSDYAWGQDFSNGLQYDYRKDYCFRARAVRRLLVIE